MAVIRMVQQEVRFDAADTACRGTQRGCLKKYLNRVSARGNRRKGEELDEG